MSRSDTFRSFLDIRTSELHVISHQTPVLIKKLRLEMIADLIADLIVDLITYLNQANDGHDVAAAGHFRKCQKEFLAGVFESVTSRYV